MSRSATDLRPIRITRGFTKTAAGSVLWHQGDTVLLCTAAVSNEVPPWFNARSVGGWLTAEYVMLPASTPTRKPWPKTGHTDSRGTEIQRMIGRAIRAVVDLTKIGPHTIHLDCQVLQADGGTRTAAICGAYLALRDALAGLPRDPGDFDPERIPGETQRAYAPAKALVDELAAVSAGVVDGRLVLDLDYALDSRASVDFNVAVTAGGKYVEVQGSAEHGEGFSHPQLLELLELARGGCGKILHVMRAAT